MLTRGRSGAKTVLSAVEALPFGVAVTDVNGIVTWANPEFAQLAGCAADEVRGQSAGEFAFAELARTAPRPEPWLREAVCRRKTGEVYRAKHSITPLRNPAGDVTGFWITKQESSQESGEVESTDLLTRHGQAERKNAKKTLSEAENKFRNIFDGALEGIYRTTMEGSVLEANHAMARMLGYDSAQEVVSSITDSAQQVWLDPEGRAHFLELLERHGVVRGHECRHRRKDGSVIWVSLNSRKVCGEDGLPLYIEGFIEDISDRKRIEEALRKSEEKFARTFLCSPAIITICDINDGGRLIEVNEAFERATGYRREEAIGRDAEELGLWADPGELEESIKQFRETARLRNFESRFRRKNGDIGIGLSSSELIELDGKPYAVSAIIDITERKNAEANLKAQHERFQRIIEHTDAGYFRIGLDGCYEDVNPAWLRMHGFTRREDAIGLHFSRVQVSQDSAESDEILKALLRGGSETSGEFSRLRRDGTIGHHSFSANAVLDGNRVIGAEGFLIDISDLKIAEQERLQSDQRYRSLFDSMHEGVAVHRLTYSGGGPDNYVLLDVNRRFEEIVGIRQENVANRLATDVYGVPAPPYLKEFASAVQTQSPFDFETYFKPLHKHFNISVAPMGEDLFATIFFDVTEQKKAEETMRSLATAIEQAGETIVITGLDGTIQYCNPAFEKITGYSKEEAIGQNPRVLKSGKHAPEFYQELWSTIMQGKVWSGRLINKKKDGSLYEEDATISPIKDASGQRLGFVAVKRDVTERLHLEEQFRQAQKLESVGRLAGGVAHDFNNLLTVVCGYSDLLLKQLKPRDPLRSFAEEIKKAGDRAAGLTRQLLAFSRKQVIKPRVLDLNATIKDCAPMLQRLIGEDIALEMHPARSLGQVLADPVQIHQVIMNLAVNARDAMPDGGKLDIQTENADLMEGRPSHPDAVPGRYVLITVTDTGHGMDQTVREKIFEPFFTTKEAGQGTGLGLSTVYGIIRQSGGWIDVWSEVGAGTSFKLYFPRMDESPTPEEIRDSAPEQAGVETILVVEDQETVRCFMKTALRQHGYRVIEASDGNAALELVKQHSGEIHLLLTDVVMPGMNGKELSERLKILRPNLKVLFTSGYTTDVIGKRGVLDYDVAYIQKPFSHNGLAEKVREVLGEPPSSTG